MELVLALREELLEDVVQLMDMMTVYSNDSTSSSVHSLSGAAEWAPGGAEKCLKFLQAAVWVMGKQCVAIPT